MVALADHDTMRSVPEMRERAAGSRHALHSSRRDDDQLGDRPGPHARRMASRSHRNARGRSPRCCSARKTTCATRRNAPSTSIEHNGRRIPSLASVQGDLPLRPHHVFTAMIRDGHATGFKQAHDIVRALGEPVVVDVPLDETVDAAHAAGALAIVAHPGRDEGMGVLDDEKLDRMLASDSDRRR